MLYQLVPSWFFGLDIVIEIVFFVISMVLAYYAFRIHKMSGSPQIKIFSTAFFMISLSYLIQSIFNFFILFDLNRHISAILKLTSILFWNQLGLYSHMFFMTTGLVLLSYMTLKVDKKRVFLLLYTICMSSIILSRSSLFVYYLISSINLTFISLYYLENYLRNRQPKTLLVFTAFIFLLFGSVHFLVSVNHQLFYVLGHVLELVAYLLILANFFLMRK